MPPSPSPSDSNHSDSDSASISALETLIDSDPSLGAYRAQRLQQLHSEHALAKQLRAEGHGTYVEIRDEKELMEKVTGTRWCVVHFFKDGFRRCGVMDGHLESLSTHPPHIRTLFLRINVTNAPFLVTKLRIRVLPCVIAFIDSVASDRIVGFEGLGTIGGDGDGDEFSTKVLEARLAAAGVVFANKNDDDNDNNQIGMSLLPHGQNQNQKQNLQERDHEGDSDDDGGGGGGGGGGFRNTASDGYLGRGKSS